MESTSVESVAAPSSGGKFQFTLNHYIQPAGRNGVAMSQCATVKHGHVFFRAVGVKLDFHFVGPTQSYAGGRPRHDRTLSFYPADRQVNEISDKSEKPRQAR
jgi:hypothetical protein